MLGWALSASFAHAAPSTTVTIQLPDTGAYTYWVQSVQGPLDKFPKAVKGLGTIALTRLTAGETFYVLDPHTGEIATYKMVAADLGQTVTVAISDFAPVSVAGPAKTAAPAVVPVPPAPTPPPHDNRIQEFLSGLIGLAVGAGVVWLIVLLVRSRGALLIHVARRAGIDVPDPLEPMPEPEPVRPFQASAPRAVEPVPDDATAPALPGAISFGSVGSPDDGPRMIGVRGLAAGNTFPLTSRVVTIGREEDNVIVLAETTVSRHHARIVRDAGGQVAVSDEGSANGVYVNGQRVDHAILISGDDIKIGDNIFRYEA